MAGLQSAARNNRLPRRGSNGSARVVVVVEYDGTNYCGFQRQLHEPTIQAQLESALSQVTQEECRVVAAGRTDTGVHARGQVVHFQTKWRHSQLELLRAMNALLPGDVGGQRIFPVAADFHARNSALSRFYRYVVFNGEVRSPLAERFAYWVSKPLNVRDMNRASECLVGTHDFASFGQSPCDGHTVREVYGASWWRQGDWVFFDIEANAFLRRMVRSLVGTLLLVGRGAILPEEISRILRAKNRQLAGPTAPPQGLCLERVCYGEPWQEII